MTSPASNQPIPPETILPSSNAPADRPPPQKLILETNLCPGDVLTLTAAVESLHATYPGQYLTDVRTHAHELWQHNPHITPIDDTDRTARRIPMHYPTINRCNQTSVTFLAGYTEYLGEVLGRPLRVTTNRPHVYLTADEMTWQNQIAQHFTGGKRIPFWLLCGGVKADYTAKAWPLEYYEDLVRQTAGLVTWAQIGANEHNHPPIAGALDLRGKTDHRQLARLVFHSSGGLGPVTYLQHLTAAFQKPYICLLGGREPATWTQYPLQTTLHTLGALPCCATGACWKSRTVPTGDKDPKDAVLCEQPLVGLRRPAPRCMAMIRPDDVIAALRRYTTR